MPALEARDLMSSSTTRPSVVSTHVALREVVAKMTEDPASREVYVVDEQGRFHGVITLRRLLRFVFTHELPDKSSAIELLELVSAERAGDLALEEPVCVREDDSLRHAIETMLRFDLNEIPVVDRDRFIVGSLSMLDLLAAWHAGGLDGMRG